MRIAIIGGGIAGMAAAYELELARSSGATVQYSLLEAGSRLGGVLSSEQVNGLVIEHGPDSFLTEKPAAAELCREIGLSEELIPSNDAERQTCIVVNNRLIPLPDGLMFLIPTKLIPTALTPLFSLKTKLRMALELLHPPRPSEDDESVAALVERHFGEEVVDRLADPLLSGIYGGDARHLSARTVLPKMVEMETMYGSMTRGMLAAHRAMRKRMAAQKATPTVNDKRQNPRGIFTTLRGGLQQMVDTLEQRIDPSCVRLNTPVTKLAYENGSWRVAAGETSELYDAVILATPAWVAGAMLKGVDIDLGDELSIIPYSSSITVNLVYDEKEIGPLPKGFGFLVPQSEKRAMLACTFVHRKFVRETASGKAVLRAFLGGMRKEAMLDESDESLVATVRRELEEILGKHIVGQHMQPERVHVARWRRAMAQYSVGHKDRVQWIRKRAATFGGLKLAGNAYDGIGISDCIRLGRMAVRELIAECARQSNPVEDIQTQQHQAS
ncbi:MAG TPA: protoporphyrinogen oxidase [Terracidiphilus sp.]|jgi:oxygen-dependent protoporphyrinogen oxidase|nr:protoporphyrinogen oxidase [Terracidiphilus sp.]